MNVFLETEMEKMENELFLWKWKYEELRQTKLESLKQVCQQYIVITWSKKENLVFWYPVSELRVKLCPRFMDVINSPLINYYSV